MKDGIACQHLLDRQLYLRLYSVFNCLDWSYLLGSWIQDGYLLEHLISQVFLSFFFFLLLQKWYFKSGYWVFLILLWGHCQICVAYFWSCVMSNPNRATGKSLILSFNLIIFFLVFGYILCLIQSTAGILLNFLGKFLFFVLVSYSIAFSIDHEPPFYYMIYPPLSFIRLAFLISHTQATDILMLRPEFHLQVFLKNNLKEIKLN